MSVAYVEAFTYRLVVEEALRATSRKRLCVSMPRSLHNGTIADLVARESYGRRVYRRISI